MRPLALIDVASVGEETSNAFVTREHGCSFERVVSAVYPKSPQAEQLHEFRHLLGLSLRQAALRVGLSASEVSALEWGQQTLSVEDWSTLFARLRGSLCGRRR